MKTSKIKDEIRKLNRIDKMEIFTWLDREISIELIPRIGVDRSLQIRTEIEQKCRVGNPERRGCPGNAIQGSVDGVGQASPGSIEVPLGGRSTANLPSSSQPATKGNR